jgi:diguanylate cyclase (GGDEF)-like protein
MPTLFVLGLLGICLGDLGFAQTSLGGGPIATIAPAGWLLGFGTVGAAARVYRGTTSRQSLPPSTGWLVFTPYLALVPAAATMGWQALSRGGVPTTELVAGMVVVLLVFVRQLLILTENRSLVARLMASEELLRHQASHDGLTGLGNRTLLVDRLENTLKDRQPLSLIFCDLDDFKTVNDTLGHHAGDELLTQVGQRLRAVTRPEDTVVRLGGDEFAAVMACSPTDARAVADRLWEAFQEPYPVLGQRLTVRASIGVATLTADTSMDADELLRAADDAMYRAKRSGKNGVRAFEPVPT